MKCRELTEQEYMKRLRMVIAGAEGLHEKVQNVGDGRATIGWGLTLNRDNNVEIWRRAGIELSAADWALLAQVDNAKTRDDKTQLGLRLSVQLDEVAADRLLRSSLWDFERPANRLKMPLSDERIALTSVAYNRGPGALLGSRNDPEHPVMQAIRDGNRAEAWYQLRYNCWGTRVEAEGGLRKRRFAEAQVFGLYDDPEKVSPDEARRVLAMFDRHRTEIDRVEDRFGDSLDAPPAKPNRIAQANRDYAELTALYGRVPTLEAALAPARSALAHSVSASDNVELQSAERPRATRPAPAAADSALVNTLDEAAHPLLRQSRDAVRRLDESLGRTYDDASARMAASLAYLAGKNGFHRIDHVVLSNATPTVQKGENAFVVQGGLTDTTNLVAYMKTQDALAAPAEQSLERLAQVTQEQALQRDALSPEVQARQSAQRMVL
jgi:GH24 family phage-related lysozyme (muramidase)